MVVSFKRAPAAAHARAPSVHIPLASHEVDFLSEVSSAVVLK